MWAHLRWRLTRAAINCIVYYFAILVEYSVWWVQISLVVCEAREIDILATVHRTAFLGCMWRADCFAESLLSSNRNIDLVYSDCNITRLFSFNKGRIRDVVWPRVCSLFCLGDQVLHFAAFVVLFRQKLLSANLHDLPLGNFLSLQRRQKDLAIFRHSANLGPWFSSFPLNIIFFRVKGFSRFEFPAC